MKAWQYVADNQPLALNEIDEPVAGPGDVVVEVKGAGICHTDVGFLDGTISHLLAFQPITLGHEVAGIIHAVGEGVSDFAVGDRVAVHATVEGPGTSRDGGFQRFMAVQADVLVPLPDGVPWDQAAVSTDAGTTSYNAVMVKAGSKPGVKIGIIGFGGLGSLGTHIARRAGAEVYVVETKVDLHAKILATGAVAVSTSIEDFKDEQLDAIVDFAGMGHTTASAVISVKPGGTVVQLGLAERFGTIDLVTLTMNEVKLIGSVGGTNRDNADVLQLMADGHLKSETEIIGFDEIGEAVERLRRGENRGRLAVIFD